MFDTPIILNNYNRLTTTKNLAAQFLELGYTHIYILDNQSTYPPLLQWYVNCPYHVIYLDGNHGEMGYWSAKSRPLFKDKKWVVYTDSDIELNPKMPKNFVEKFIEVGAKYNYKKVGSAIEIFDLPTNDHTHEVINWESKFWRDKLEPEVYRADVGGTLSVFRGENKFDYKAIRIGGDYTIKHIPWYTNFYKLDDEERYFLETSKNDFSTYKKYYDTFLGRK